MFKYQSYLSKELSFFYSVAYYKFSLLISFYNYVLKEKINFFDLLIICIFFENNFEFYDLYKIFKF